MNKKQIILFSIILFVTSCELILPCRDTDFVFNRIENKTTKLKLGGYYYGDLVDNNSEVDVYLLNQNGVTRVTGPFDINDAEAGNISLNIPESYYNYKAFWGVYRIEEDSIEIQSWTPMNNGCVRALILKGFIINDTTFKITKWQTKKNNDFSEWTSVNSYFKFHKYSPKPDSVVSFIP